MLLGTRKSRTELYHRYSKASELPLLVLAIIMVPVLVAPEVMNLTADQDGALEAIDWFIYGCFAFDLVLKLYLAPSVSGHLKRNWLDLVVVLLPLLRPLRLVSSVRFLRLLRAVRVIAFVAEGAGKLLSVLRKRGFHIVLLATMGLVVLSAGVMTVLERDGGGNIRSFGDAIWWALATISTVGYGDAFPVTPEGRGVAVFLMLAGVVFYSILTANLAAFFVGSEDTADIKRVEAKLDLILNRLDAIENSEGPKKEREA